MSMADAILITIARGKTMKSRLVVVAGVLLALTLAVAQADFQQSPEFAPSDRSTSQNRGNDANQSNSLANKNAPRGKLLYENHCHACHDSLVHVRENHRATSKMEIQYWVVRWSTELKLGWTLADVTDVVDYLAVEFYQLNDNKQ